jgi:indole-3-glycerol phosphate synthase
VELPLLRKDFIIDRYQLLQARAAGADCVLLIAECLSAEQLRELTGQAAEFGMQALIELYEAENLPAVLATGTPLVGINNRNLHTFETSLDHTLELRPQIPDDRLVVGESGIRCHDDLVHLGNGGVKAVLVGESLMRQPDIVQATRKLLGR